MGNLPIFSEHGVAFERAIVKHFQTRIFVPDDYVVEYGDTGLEMFIIKDGACRVTTGDGKVELAFLKAGDYFGDIDMILGVRRIAAVKTITYCTLLVLKR
ncbi:unnamed protein product [Ostreobium quekettii]|uniref:Cyclic nucleotide-binding domain-containing protein n=1 Tax=Ostreobium quekettii TaxID=121088 RepID=A0A8S1IS15_9CHLO|nr:unnamed protein product [Ostreobium quekettii]|eukprot:evm.model.scf_84.5 EVM.evm.TU.scf_84.5   scf_84:73668-78010(-)